MRAYMGGDRRNVMEIAVERASDALGDVAGRVIRENLEARSWPLPNVWLGVSVEDQETADERIPVLLETPAAKRFVSYEPALGPVDFQQIRNTVGMAEGQDFIDALEGRCWVASGPDYYDTTPADAQLDWIIVGGESGPGARPFDVAWARSTVEQCKAAGVACFVKQIGSRPRGWCRAILEALGPEYPPLEEYPADYCDAWEAGEGSCGDRRCVFLQSRKGDDPSEWPDDLRVQEFPA
jgi:protein gp37